MHQLRVGLLPLPAQMVRQALFGVFGLSPGHAVNRVDQRQKILPLFMAHVKVLILLFLFLLSKDLFRVFVAVGAGLRVGDADIKDGLTSAIPEAVAACIAALFRDRSFCVGLWLPLLLPLLLLCFLSLLLRRWRGG